MRNAETASGHGPPRVARAKAESPLPRQLLAIRSIDVAPADSAGRSSSLRLRRRCSDTATDASYAPEDGARESLSGHETPAAPRTSTLRTTHGVVPARGQSPGYGEQERLDRLGSTALLGSLGPNRRAISVRPHAPPSRVWLMMAEVAQDLGRGTDRLS
jgi:hypothetical protein